MNTARRKRLARCIHAVLLHTPFIRTLLLLVLLWPGFSAALYWGVAVFSTAGIADTLQPGAASLVGGIWIVLGSVLFFGTIVATITSCFMRPMQRPAKRIIDTIEYSLEQRNDLTLEELDLLKETVATLITHVEHLKESRRQKFYGKRMKALQAAWRDAESARPRGMQPRVPSPFDPLRAGRCTGGAV